jgi:hypothetical protein
MWPAIAAIASIAGGVIGQNAAASGRSAAQDAAKKAQDIIARVDIPDIEKQKLVMEELAATGQFTPEMLQAIAQENSAFEDVSIDPRLKQEQMKALDMISNVSESGLSEGDLASIELVKREADAASRARQNTIVQEMQQRGMGGSGVELAARLSGAQEASDRGAQAALETAKLAAQQRLSALGQLGTLSGNIRGQEYNEQSDLAKARDLINQFNIENQRSVSNTNVGLRNQAQATNLGEQQRIADSNVQLRNAQQQFNKGLIQKDFDNRMEKAGLQSGLKQKEAAQLQEDASDTAGGIAKIGQGVGSLISSFGKK